MQNTAPNVFVWVCSVCVRVFGVFWYKYYIYYINKSKDRQTDGRKKERKRRESVGLLECYLTGTDAFKHQIPACQTLILLNNKLHLTRVSRSRCLIMKNEWFWSWNTCSNGSVWASNVRNSVRIRKADFVDNRSICSHLTNAFYKTHNKLSLNAKMKEIRSELNELWIFERLMSGPLFAVFLLACASAVPAGDWGFCP